MSVFKDPGASALQGLVAELAAKFPYASAYLMCNRSLNVRSTTREEGVNEAGPSLGAVFSVWNGEGLEEVATGDLSDDGLAAAARILLSRPVRKGDLPGEISGPGRDICYRTPMEIDPATITLEEKLALCRQTRDRAKGLDPRIIEAGSTYSEERVDALFVDAGSVLSQEIVRVAFGFNATFRDGGAVRFDGESNRAAGGYELTALTEDKWEAVRRRIPGLLKATTIDPGLYDIVACPGAAGIIAHEAFGHGVETDMFLKGRARSQEYMGKRVGSPLVDLFDDPTYPGGFGSYGFDDQGQPASKTQIVKNGVFVQGLTDLYSAVRLGIPRTANGRRENVNKAYPRMTNTYFGPGEDNLEDMIASVKEGIYLGQMQSGMEDPKDWGLQCIFSWAQAIKDGKLTDKYHTNVGLTGYVPDLLGSVSMVGNDLKLSAGGCGKGYKEWVRVGMGGPHLKIKGRLG